jgi:predicted SAM-dependent methyltransferase
MILHLGCGDSPQREGYLNVDIRSLPNVDVVADVRHLPFEDGQFAGIYTRNLIEHFGRHEITGLLKEWARVIKVGGVAVIETVDAGRLMDIWRSVPTDNLLDGMLGAQTYPENFHKMLFSEELLTEKLHEAGFAVTKIVNTVYREIPRIIVTAEKL